MADFAFIVQITERLRAIEWWDDSLFLVIMAMPILMGSLFYAYRYFKQQEKELQTFADKQVEMTREQARMIIDSLPSCSDDSTMFSSTETRE